MAHEVETMMYVGETPWHRLGVGLKAPPTTREAIVAAGLDWTVSLEQLQLGDGRKVQSFAAVRDTDKRVLGCGMGSWYHLLQNHEAFAWFDPMVQSGEVTLESAGSLREGERIWVLAKINRPDSVIVSASDDRVAKYLLLSNTHDGKRSTMCGYTPIRVVCQNTLSAAINAKASSLLSVRHTRHQKQALEGVRDAMNLIDATFEATAEQFRLLAMRGVSVADLRTYVERVFQVTINPRVKKGAVAPLAAGGVVVPLDELASANDAAPEEFDSRILEKIVPLFEKGRGNDMRGVKGTLWAAYNAVTEYVAHERRGDDATRLDSTWFGNGQTINRRAFSEAVAMLAA